MSIFFQVVGMVALSLLAMYGLRRWDRWLVARFDRGVSTPAPACAPRVVIHEFAEAEAAALLADPEMVAALAWIDSLPEVEA